jgi:hypothetical protein
MQQVEIKKGGQVNGSSALSPRPTTHSGPRWVRFKASSAAFSLGGNWAELSHIWRNFIYFRL